MFLLWFATWGIIGVVSAASIGLVMIDDWMAMEGDPVMTVDGGARGR
jgi:hypothetical protein